LLEAEQRVNARLKFINSITDERLTIAETKMEAARTVIQAIAEALDPPTTITTMLTQQAKTLVMPSFETDKEDIKVEVRTL